MKRIALGFTMVVAAAAVFASGAPETDDWNRGSSRMGEAAEVSMTGTYTEDETGAYLETSDGVYSLSAPGYRRQDVDLESGERIAVEGLLTDCTEYELSRGRVSMPRRPGMRPGQAGPGQAGPGRPMAGRGARPGAPQDDRFGPQGRRLERALHTHLRSQVHGMDYRLMWELPTH